VWKLEREREREIGREKEREKVIENGCVREREEAKMLFLQVINQKNVGNSIERSWGKIRIKLISTKTSYPNKPKLMATM